MQKPAINEVLTQTIKSGVTNISTYERADKAKVGRKRILENERTNKTIMFYLNNRQLEALKAIAENECLSPQAFVKKEILKIIKSNNIHTTGFPSLS